jgi:hypothetical protein
VRGAADSDSRHRLRLHDAAGKREDILLALRTDEECRAVPTRRREVRHTAALQFLGDLVAKALSREAVARNGEKRRVIAVGLEPEGGHPARSLAVVEPVVLQILEQVAGKAELGRAHRAPAGELEGERRLSVVKDEPVVLAEVPALARCLERHHLAGGDHWKLECAFEAKAIPCVALDDHAAALVDESEAATEVVADDGQERLQPTALEHRRGEALVHLECTGGLLELLVGEMRDGRLRDRDERNLVRDGQDRERQGVAFLHDRRRHGRKAEADSEAEPCEAVLGEPANVCPLRRHHLAHAEARGEQELSALEELRRVSELGNVQPADLVPKAVSARGDGQAEPGELRDLLDRQQGIFRRTGQDGTTFARLRQPSTRLSWTRGPEEGPRRRATRRTERLAAFEDFAGLGDAAGDHVGRREQDRGDRELPPVDRLGRDCDDEDDRPDEQEDDELAVGPRHPIHPVIRWPVRLGRWRRSLLGHDRPSFPVRCPNPAPIR